MMTVSERALALIASGLGYPSIDPRSNIRYELGPSQLAYINLIMALEAEFNIPDIDYQYYSKFITVQDILDYLKHNVKE
jgi:acyl carrier protein